jgi:hypothetical protein
MPNMGKVLKIRGSNAQCMVQRIEVITPKASQFNRYGPFLNKETNVRKENQINAILLQILRFHKQRLILY